MAITHAAKVESEQHGDRLPRVEMALEALRNVIKYNPGNLRPLQQKGPKNSSFPVTMETRGQLYLAIVSYLMHY